MLNGWPLPYRSGFFRFIIYYNTNYGITPFQRKKPAIYSQIHFQTKIFVITTDSGIFIKHLCHLNILATIWVFQLKGSVE